MDASESNQDRSLDILRIARAVYPESMGGGAIHVNSMSKKQVEMGHNVTVLTTDGGDITVPREESRDGYTIRRCREIANLFGNSLAPGFVSAFRRHKQKYDVVHVHSHLSSLSNIAALFSRFDDIPMILTNHGLRSQTAPDWIQQIYLPTIGRFTFNSADRVLCYSDSERGELREQHVRSPITVIHNGVDCTTFAPAGVDRELQLLFVGRLMETKGPDLLLSIFERLAPDFSKLSLTIVGDGPLATQLEQHRSNSQFTSRISLLGDVPNEELPEIYSESSVFVLPTSREGVPRTILEAMACETPIVTTSLPQVEPVLGEGGCAVDRDPDSFEAVLRELLQDGNRRRMMGKAARQRVLKNYSWDETVRETTATYLDLLET